MLREVSTRITWETDVNPQDGAASRPGAALANAQTPLPPKAKITSSVMLWTLKGSFEERVEIAARAGMQSVELVAEYADWTDADVRCQEEVCPLLQPRHGHAHRDAGLDQATGVDGRSRAARQLPRRRQKRDHLGQEARSPADHSDERQCDPRTHYDQQYASLLEGAKRAADLAATADVTLIVEPLNSKVDHKGYFLTTCTEGLKLVQGGEQSDT